MPSSKASNIPTDSLSSVDAVGEQAAVRPEQYVGQEGQVAYVQYPGQDPAQIRDTDLQKAIDGGAKVSSEAEYNAAVNRIVDEQYGDVGGMATSGLMGAADMASLGTASGLIGGGLKLLGMDNAANYIRNAEKVNPKSYLVGGIAPLVAGGAAAIAAKGIKGAGEALVSGVQQSLSKQGAVQMLKALPASAAVGAGYGLGSEWSRQTLEDTPYNGERLLGSGLMGGVLGALMTPVAVAAGNVASAAAVQAEQAGAKVAGQRINTVLKDIAGASEEDLQAAIAARKANGEDLQARVMQEARDQGAGINKTFKEELEGITKETAENIRSAREDVAERVLGRSERYDEVIGKNVSESNKIGAHEAFQGLTRSIDTEIENLSKRLDYMPPKIEQVLRDIGEIRTGVTADSTSAEVFKAVDDLAKRFRALAEFDKNVPVDSFSPTAQVRKLGGDLFQQSRQIRENPELFGEMAVITKQVNRAMFSRIEAEKEFQSTWMEKRKDGLWYPSNSKILNNMRSMTSVTKERQVEAAQNFLAAAKNEAELIGKYFGKEAKPDLSSIRETVASITKGFERVQTVQTYKNQKAQEAANSLLVTLMGKAPIVGKYAEPLAKFMASPIARAEAAGKMDRIIESFSFGKAKGASKAPVYNRNQTLSDVKALRTGLGNADLVNKMTSYMDSTGATNAAKSAKAALDYLDRNLPSTVPKIPTDAKFDLGRIADSELVKAHKILNVVKDPTTVLNSVKSGKLDSVETEALKNVYPEVFDKMRTKLIGVLSSDSTKVPEYVKIKLGLMFDFPASEAMLHTQRFQQAYEEDRKKADDARKGGASASRNRPPTHAGASQTQSQALEEKQ